MKAKQNKLVDLENFIDVRYGKSGAKKREIFEAGYETFKLNITLQKTKKEPNIPTASATVANPLLPSQ